MRCLLAVLLFACAEAPEAGTTALTGKGGDLFVNVTAAAGISHTYEFPPGIRDISHAVVNIGGGAVAEDLDEDGLPDLFLADGAGNNTLYWNVGGGRFEDGSEAAGVRFADEWTTAVGAADLDNDGDQDLYLLNRGLDRVLRNDGARRFTDIAPAVGLALDGPGLGVHFGDLDGDRRLDIFVGASSGEFHTGATAEEVLSWGLAQSRVYQAMADGTYREVQQLILPNGLPKSNPFMGAMLDLDADSDLDLFLVEDAQGRVLNALYENRGWNAATGFVDLVDVSKTCGCESPMAGMGLGVLDYDSNGLPDLYITNIHNLFPNREALLLNQGKLVFRDITEQIGAFAMDPYADLGPRSVSWSALAIDVQNDTLEDILINYGELVMDPRPDGTSLPGEEFLRNQPDALLLAKPDGMYEIAPNAGIEDLGRSHASVVADFDGDGCQDVFTINLETPSNLFRNRCPGGYSWIAFDLEGVVSNRDAVGARIRVKALGRTQWRQLSGCSTGTHSCGPKRVHFGLGPASQVDEVEIHWPKGKVETLAGLASGRVHRLVEPSE